MEKTQCINKRRVCRMGALVKYIFSEEGIGALQVGSQPVGRLRDNLQGSLGNSETASAHSLLNHA